MVVVREVHNSPLDVQLAAYYSNRLSSSLRKWFIEWISLELYS